MENISNKVSYVKGLIDGLKIDETSNEGKIFKAILEILDEVNECVDDLYDYQDEMSERIDMIDDDLATVEMEFQILLDEWLVIHNGVGTPDNITVGGDLQPSQGNLCQILCCQSGILCEELIIPHHDGHAHKFAQAVVFGQLYLGFDLFDISRDDAVAVPRPIVFHAEDIAHLVFHGDLFCFLEGFQLFKVILTAGMDIEVHELTELLAAVNCLHRFLFSYGKIPIGTGIGKVDAVFSFVAVREGKGASEGRNVVYIGSR